MKTKKPQNEYERLIQDPKMKARFEKGYAKFVLSELLLEFMEKEKISVRGLAERSGVSPSMIQGIRKEEKSNITLNTLKNIFGSLGCDIILKKNNKTYPLFLS